MQETHAATQDTATTTAGTYSIRGLSVVGGFLDGMRLEFTDGLNCIIGARGTGKTTVLELIRYALDQLPRDPTARKRLLGLVQENLGGGTVQVEIMTRDGLPYRVCRAWNEAPIVRTVDDRPTQVTLQGGSLFRADIYSQNQIERIAEDAPAQLALLDQFEVERIERLEGEIHQVQLALTQTTNRILPLRRQIAALADEVATLPNVEEKVNKLASDDADVSDEVNVAHRHKALRDREQRLAQATSRLLSETSRYLAARMGDVPQRIKAMADPELLEGPNGDLTRTLLEAAYRCGAAIDKALDNARTDIAAAQETLSRLGATMTTLHNQQELKFRQVIETHKQAQGRVAERAELERLRNDLLAKRRQRGELQLHLDEAENERVCLVERLLKLRGERFGVRQAVVMRINAALKPALRVSLDEQGDVSGFQRLLEEWLREAKMKHGIVARRIATAMGPTLLGEAIRSGDAELLVAKSDLNPSQAERVIQTLDDPGFLFALETLDMNDRPTIELLDCGKYKQSLSLSTGQKCTSILPILLLENQSPLLIDQPEDNLDNGFIYSTIVSNIQAIKQHRQLIFVTHNPNIPVLGDARRVFVLKSDERGSSLAQSGTVDQCKERIVNLLEGGREAFQQRGQRYNN